ncbi:MAG: bifunctional methylenetetrahydrofolate dehydrogenase/methenyltetrahydrofolate cyclohydrolase FolD [Bdellovibrio sp.]|nr:MAG: bifunctional methylenetetrahydrofolate dehydrogenase/methenyltetrahydrofolate cyclohydrolase FolD [Bdellovibrio sp.]
MQLLKGHEVSKAVRSQIQKDVEKYTQKVGHPPGLAVLLIGDDPASQVYVRNKEKACKEVGIRSVLHHLSENTSSNELYSLINHLNKDPSIQGILIQLPLPPHLQSEQILNWISPHKDVDGLTLENVGRLFSGRPRVVPCTPAGVMKILEHYQIPVEGKEAVVIGRSHIVGLPMFQLLQKANATVTLCHSRTPNLQAHTQKADLVVVAAGKPGLLGREDFKKDAVVIDVGIHREIVDGKTRLCGDVRSDELKDWVKAITPVPGGVGPMTITMLLFNTMELAFQQITY